ncbi:MAG: leucine-rich repeat domain-containing protein [Patescibacteria group bacterium]|jgi:Leucine-rich repeat (LRR) protein
MKNILLVLAIFLLMGASCSFDKTSIDNLVENTTNTEQKIEQEDINVDISNKDSLDLSGQGLQQVDQSVFKKTNLLKLDVSNNQLTGALPSQINQLQRLQVLNASNNKMTGVPAEIGQLSNLIELNLANNQLTGLPYELGNLQNLKILNLSGNQTSRQDLDIIRQSLPSNVQIIE